MLCISPNKPRDCSGTSPKRKGIRMCPRDSPTPLQNTHTKGHLGPDTKSSSTSLIATTFAFLCLFFPSQSHFLYLSRKIFTDEFLWLKTQLSRTPIFSWFSIRHQTIIHALKLKHIGKTGIHAWFLPCFVGPTATSVIPSGPRSIGGNICPWVHVSRQVRSQTGLWEGHQGQDEKIQEHRKKAPMLQLPLHWHCIL